MDAVQKKLRSAVDFFALSGQTSPPATSIPVGAPSDRPVLRAMAS